MCIILSKVNKVSNTKIYVSPDEENARQITIYSNEVATRTKNAMILPVPNPESIELLDLSKYSKFFEDCDNCFVRIPTLSLTRSYNLPHMYATSSILPVVQVGSYMASIVPSFDDFVRIDTSVFDIDDTLLSMLAKNYREGFGFIVCLLKEGSHTYHPFAYTHRMKNPNRLFIPTRHYHPGETNTYADWDHTIYSPITELHNTKELKFRDSSPIKWNKLPESYRWASSVPFSRWTMESEWKNIDLEPESFYRKRVY
jgi:hypothetical protein